MKLKTNCLKMLSLAQVRRMGIWCGVSSLISFSLRMRSLMKELKVATGGTNLIQRENKLPLRWRRNWSKRILRRKIWTLRTTSWTNQTFQEATRRLLLTDAQSRWMPVWTCFKIADNREPKEMSKKISDKWRRKKLCLLQRQERKSLSMNLSTQI